MAGSKKYEVYVKPKARKYLATQQAVRRLNRQLGGGKTVRIVTNKRRSDATIGLGLGGTKYVGKTTSRPNRDVIKINKAAKGTVKKAYVRTISHEIGHGLGLEHTGGKRNLMNPSTGGRKLRPTQKRKVRKTKRSGGYS